MLRLPAAAEVERHLFAELRLVYGIGPVRADDLRASGSPRLPDLIPHPRFGETAARLIEQWEDRDLGALQAVVRARMGAAHPLNVLIASAVGRDGLLLLDLETLGLSGAAIILFGLAFMRDSALEIHQFLARSAGEEPAGLHLAIDALRHAGGIVTYNGLTAEEPWLRQRCAYYRLGGLPEMLHLDLYHPTRARRTWDGDCRLHTVERELLKVERQEEDLPGSLVPRFYKEYKRRGNVGPLVPIIEHNRADLVALAHLLALLAVGVSHIA
jgi:hypothetical protein